MAQPHRLFSSSDLLLLIGSLKIDCGSAEEVQGKEGTTTRRRKKKTRNKVKQKETERREREREAERGGWDAPSSLCIFLLVAFLCSHATLRTLLILPLLLLLFHSFSRAVDLAPSPFRDSPLHTKGSSDFRCKRIREREKAERIKKKESRKSSRAIVPG